MKGLLIKDFKLMKGQRNFLLMIIAISIGSAFAMEDLTFLVGYMTALCSMFTLSSISYDEFENGNAFLFSLPITRKSYVAEKYTFALIVSGVSWVFSTVIATIAGGGNADVIMAALLIFAVLLLFLAIMLPVQLKFGGEKGRIVMFAVIGVIVLIGFFINEIADLFQIDPMELMNRLSSMSKGMLTIIAFGIAMFGLLVSYGVSVAIMKKKEF